MFSRDPVEESSHDYMVDVFPLLSAKHMLALLISSQIPYENSFNRLYPACSLGTRHHYVMVSMQFNVSMIVKSSIKVVSLDSPSVSLHTAEGINAHFLNLLVRKILSS